MLAEHIGKSNIIELVEDELDEESQVYRATIKVLPDMGKRWIKMMTAVLKEAADEDGFDIEPHKSYYWREGSVRFVWVLLVWGDLETAKEAIGDLFETRYEPKPAPPKAKDPRMRPTGRSTLSRSEKTLADGTVEVRTSAKVAHAKGGRYDGDPHEVVGLGDRGRFKARTSGRGEAGFAPKKGGI